jgi:hypothetical protein
MPEEQLCKIIANNDALHGVPPSPPENVAYRIERAREAMRNDTTWEHTDSSEREKEQATRSLGNLVGSQSKTPSSIIHHLSRRALS